MTRDEKIKRLKALKARCERLIVSSNRGPEGWRKDAEALDQALTALRGPTREQVERMRGEWIHDGPNFEGGTDWYHCSKCGAKETGVYVKHNFCSHCGAPMTDEAVDMVMERWKEALE